MDLVFYQNKCKTRLYHKEVRLLRKQAHQVFDKLWRCELYPDRLMARVSAYRWLARQMGMRYKECHFSVFDKGLCEAAIMVCQELAIGLRVGPRRINSISYRPKALIKYLKKMERLSGCRWNKSRNVITNYEEWWRDIWLASSERLAEENS